MTTAAVRCHLDVADLPRLFASDDPAISVGADGESLCAYAAVLGGLRRWSDCLRRIRSCSIRPRARQALALFRVAAEMETHADAAAAAHADEAADRCPDAINGLGALARSQVMHKRLSVKMQTTDSAFACDQHSQ
jgi:hypothetical protein